jgi:hypothetical protein
MHRPARPTIESMACDPLTSWLLIIEHKQPNNIGQKKQDKKPQKWFTSVTTQKLESISDVFGATCFTNRVVSPTFPTALRMDQILLLGS